MSRRTNEQKRLHNTMQQLIALDICVIEELKNGKRWNSDNIKKKIILFLETYFNRTVTPVNDSIIRSNEVITFRLPLDNYGNAVKYQYLDIEESDLFFLLDKLALFRDCIKGGQKESHFNLERTFEMETKYESEIYLRENKIMVFAAEFSESLENEKKEWIESFMNSKPIVRQYKSFNVALKTEFALELFDIKKTELKPESFLSSTKEVSAYPIKKQHVCFKKLLTSFIVNFFLSFGSYNSIKICRQCKNMIVEVKAGQMKYCSDRCRKVFNKNNEPEDKFKCRNNQNHWISYQRDKKMDIGSSVKYTLNKDHCKNCVAYIEISSKGGKCKKLLEENTWL